MKRLLPIFISLALIIAYGCDKDDDNDNNPPTPTTNSPTESHKEPQYCFPADYSVPQPPIDATNRASTTTITIGLPGDPYYQVTVTTTASNSARYSDGTTYSSDGTTITDTIATAGTTNSTQSINQAVSIVLFDNTRMTSALIQHFTDGVQDQNQYNAFLECTDGNVTAITEEQFNAFRTQLGI